MTGMDAALAAYVERLLIGSGLDAAAALAAASGDGAGADLPVVVALRAGWLADESVAGVDVR